VGDGPDLDPRLAARVVVAGFGAFAPGGGFVLDRRALQAIEADPRRATVRVLGLGALEWAILAPAAWISAVVLLAVADGRVMASLLWPWAIAVPVGFGAGLWAATGARRERLSRGRPRLRLALRGVSVLHQLAAGGPGCAGAWIGAAGYWAFDIAALYGSLRFIGLHLNLGETILAFATGYALTRRSLPLGGAGVTEALMTFALHWVGVAIPAALAAVVVYRVFNFVLPTLAALLVLPRVKPLLDASDEGRAEGAPPGYSSRRIRPISGHEASAAAPDTAQNAA
jgi:uncharacterized membrane protein YbhN (UPF0104 family)